MRRTALATLAAVLFVAGLASSAPPKPGPKFFGMHDDHTWDADTSRVASSLGFEKAYGSKLTRNTLRWKVTQPTPTTFDWTRADYVVDQAAQRGMKVLLVVRDAPQWANASTDGKIIPAGNAEFNAFVTNYKNFFKAAVQRYASRVQYWEVWTEPNEHFFWQPRNLHPQQNMAKWIDMYAKLYRDTVAAVRTVNTKVELAVGALTGLGATCCILGTDFLNGLIDRGVVFNDVAINPHNSRNQAPWDSVPFAQNFSDIQLVRDTLVNRDRASVNIWVTEFGWQVAGFTSPGSTTLQLRVPGNQFRLALWPASGEVRLPDGISRNYSSITKGVMIDTNGDGVTEIHNIINLTTPLVTPPAAKTIVWSPAADNLQATYLREAIKMLRGTYTPAPGRPAQNYKYVELAMYFLNYDRFTASWGMYGLFYEPVPDFDNPGAWYLNPRPAATVFRDETD